MNGERPDQPTDRDDRIRILEFQVDHLRRELELLKARHEEAIYSVAWHVAWPIRIVERAIRRAFARKDDDDIGGAGSGAQTTSAPPAVLLDRDRIAERIARRIARPV